MQNSSMSISRPASKRYAMITQEDDAMQDEDSTDNGHFEEDDSEAIIPPPFNGVIASLRPSMRAWKFGWGSELLRRLRLKERQGLTNEEVRSGSDEAARSPLPEVLYDEFGFEQSAQSTHTSHQESVSNEMNELKWMAHLEFNVNRTGKDFDWKNIHALERTEALEELIQEGIPVKLRPQIWSRLLSSEERKHESAHSYSTLVRLCKDGESESFREIEKDLMRTMPRNVFFGGPKAPGIQRLRRILRASSYLQPDTGYCQGMGMMACIFILLFEEEEAFWMLQSLMFNFMPMSYYSMVLLGAQADQQVLKVLVQRYLPAVDEQLAQYEVELPLVSLNWFITAFSSILPIHSLLRVWDCMFFYGPNFMLKVALGVVKLLEPELVAQTDAAGIFGVLSGLSERNIDAVTLLNAAFSFEVGDSAVLRDRDMFRAKLLQDMNHTQYALRAPAAKRIRPSKSLFGEWATWLGGWMNGNAKDNAAADILRRKNVEHSERLIQLKENILQLIHHFHHYHDVHGGQVVGLPKRTESTTSMEPASPRSVDTDGRSSSAVKLPSADSHTMSVAMEDDFYQNPFQDEETAPVFSNKKRVARAKVILDHSTTQPDELPLRRGQVVRLINVDDPHCWEGICEGRHGWFPSRFVRTLEESGKGYDPAGDDTVDPAVASLVRGKLCEVLRFLFNYGFRNESFSNVFHVWDFIEDVAKHEVHEDKLNAIGHMQLSTAFALEEEQRVLSNSEQFYKAVADINASHKNAHKDMKFRSFVCMGLNEQALHVWWQMMCRCETALVKWYQPWSYLRSPVWIQIRCDLKLLSRLSFDLNRDFELKREKNAAIQEDVRDLLVTYHLFSWEL